MKSYIPTSVWGSTGTNTTKYGALNVDRCDFFNVSEGVRFNVIPAACTVRNLFAISTTTPAGGQSITLNIRKRVGGTGAWSTVLTAVIGPGAPTGNSGTNEGTFEAGDWICIQVVTVGCDGGYLRSAMECEATNPNYQIILGACPGSFDGSDRGGFACASDINTSGPYVIAGSHSEVSELFPIAGKIHSLYVGLSTAPTGATKTRTVTVRKNNVDSAFGVTFTDTEVNKNDADELAIAAGDYLCMRFTSANTPSNTTCGWGFVWEPTELGLCVRPYQMRNGWQSPPGTSWYGNNTTYSSAPIPFHMTVLGCYVMPLVATGGTVVFSNGNGTNLGDGNSTGNVSLTGVLGMTMKSVPMVSGAMSTGPAEQGVTNSSGLTQSVLCAMVYTSATVVAFGGFESGTKTYMGDPVTSFVGAGSDVVSGNARTGTYSYRAQATGAAVASCDVHRFYSYDAGTFLDFYNFQIVRPFITFYVKFAVLPAALSEEFFTVFTSGGTVMAVLRVTSAGEVALYDATTALIGTTSGLGWTTGIWYRVELSVESHVSRGRYTLNVYSDDSDTSLPAKTLSGSGADFQTSTSNYFTAMSFGKKVNQNGQSVDMYFDDYSIALDQFHPGRVKMLVPAADGAYAQFTGGDYTKLNTVPYAATNYLVSPLTIGHKETPRLQTAAQAGINGTVNALTFVASAIRDGGVNGSLKVYINSIPIRGSGVVSLGDGIGAGFTVLRMTPVVRPVEQTWATSILDALEVGAEELSAAQASRLCGAYAMVHYTGAAAQGRSRSERGMERGMWRGLR